MLPKSINCLSQSLPNSAFCWGAGYALIGASQQVQAQDGVDEVYYTKATTCTVPNGMNIVHLGEDGAGGGAGSSPYPPLRLGHGGARGAKGATVAGAVQISPGATLHLRAGMAGRPGANAMGVPTVGGVGGTEMAIEGAAAAEDTEAAAVAAMAVPMALRRPPRTRPLQPIGRRQRTGRRVAPLAIPAPPPPLKSCLLWLRATPAAASTPKLPPTYLQHREASP